MSLFSIIPAAAVTDPRVEPRDLKVLTLLGLHNDDLGWCSMSPAMMADTLRFDHAAVDRILARLVGAGYVEQRPVPGVSEAVHEYRVVIDREAGAEALNALREAVR